MDISAFFKISYGIYAVCAEFQGKKNGYIANTVFQITAEPARFALSCNKDNFTNDLIKQSGKFSFSILEENVKSEIISAFGYKSGRDIDKFDGLKYKVSDNGIPILLDGSLAYFECEVEQSIDVATHVIYVGKLISGEMIDESKIPMTYAFYREVKKGKAPKNAPTYIADDKEKIKETKTDNGRYRCPVCGYVYDESKGEPDYHIAPGTKFDELPETWICPICSAEKEFFFEI